MADRIGFIGLGNMGGRMTRRLVDGGVEVLGFDMQRPAVEAAGATPADSAAEVAGASDVVFLSLPDSKVVERVVLQDGSFIPALAEGAVVVDLSTASPASTQRIQARLAEVGVDYLDAGISGGAAAAEKGALTLMVGGDTEALDRVRPALAHFATNVFHMGGPGAGHSTKLLNNFLNAISLSATAEVMVAAKKAGLDLATVLDVLNASSGVNFATLNRFPKIITGDYLKGGLTNALMMKDVVLYVDHLHELGVASPNSSGPLASFGLAQALGYADQISNTVVDAIGDVSGGVRLHDPDPGSAGGDADRTTDTKD
ncbi:NAD(P)-dependent oxidoreductase [Herbiconiux moechotypicola]|uniref:3-hydroxyisobutyrate dehydrogenase n=1 Tax=Herbiconiux moechotypicola TaxID=637393 RepID=A0ABP5QU93_9MICO|nr:NAD(P)-dependent oxidoreductase [Herbiconiux moechotypicola]MCS5730815.1 NAD(P)-dependent oxidoreductase [Herbiconiux moechotypicola]